MSRVLSGSVVMYGYMCIVRTYIHAHLIVKDDGLNLIFSMHVPSLSCEQGTGKNHNKMST